MDLLALTRRTAAAALAMAALLAAAPAGAQEPDPFLRGDFSLDGRVDITDAIVILTCHFFAIDCFPPCEDTGDADDNGAVNITDAILLLNALFLGERVIPPPGPEGCGPDPTPDPMPDCAYDACPSRP
jgi:hypothetical protein